MHSFVLGSVLAVSVFGLAVQSFSAEGKDTFDPLGFPGDDAIVTENVVPTQPGSRTKRGTVSDSGSTSTFVLQVQFLATTNLTEARDVKKRATKALKDSVDLAYETPYYKLRAGQFVEYDKAEALAVRLRAMGYESAWVVRKQDPSSQSSPPE